tara:strand:- start:14834 stop:15607 length:774 start_codon:yes stop_codon:yes gene_type:complete
MDMRWKSRPTAARKVQLKLFGDCRLTIDGRPIQGVPASLFRVAAYLVLGGNGGIQPRHRVGALLWSDADDGKAAANMRQALARIRHLQEEHGFSFIGANFSMLQLLDEGDVQCDLTDFVDYLKGTLPLTPVELCSLYDGELLGGLGPGGEGFEEWLFPHREKFMVEAVDHIAAGLAPQMGLSESDRGICARRLLEIDPYHELALRVLMQEAANRQQIGRLTHLYESMRHLLGEDLGIQPSQETQTLYVDLMQRLKAS